MNLLFWGVLAPLTVALAGSVLVCRYAATVGLIDVPNQRSSHHQPTPRGGGMALMAAVMISWLGLASVGHLPTSLIIWLLLPGLALGGIGLVDDRSGLHPGWRLLAQALAIGPPLWLLAADAVMLLIGLGLWLWLINLYNFMDGTDGLAASQTLLIGASAALLIAVTAPQSPAITAATALAAAFAGFLVLNRPPARVFMGDGGSSFGGYLLGGVAIYSIARGDSSVWIWATLMGALLVDASVTLALRVIRGERWWAAHRQHAYQRLVRAGWRHSGVAWLYTGILVAWLGPLAALAQLGALAPWLAAMIALAPLALAVLGADRYVAIGPVTRATDQQ